MAQRKKRKAFDLGKRVDGKINKWELKDAYALGIERHPEDSYPVWVITGVYKSRREVFNG